MGPALIVGVRVNVRSGSSHSVTSLVNLAHDAGSWPDICWLVRSMPSRSTIHDQNSGTKPSNISWCVGGVGGDVGGGAGGDNGDVGGGVGGWW